MNIQEHVDLSRFNTLALPSDAQYYARAESVDDIFAAMAWAQEKQLPIIVLGGGSNVVLRDKIFGLVLHIALQGKALTRFDAIVEVRAAAGENWHELVQWTLQHGAFGLENLTLIPGTAGAAPIQNIGAYGVELCNFLHEVRGIKLDESREITLTAAQCQLGYRDSIFKRELRSNFIITEIVLHLRTQFSAVVDYPALRECLSHASKIDACAVERAVRSIRQSKLPDPAQWPNAGSFFKNPVISRERFSQLQQSFPDMPHFSAGDAVKIPAAWLIDRCGWKGRRVGDVGVHVQQALVLIHYGAAGATKLLELAKNIQRDVRQQFDIDLEMEPIVYGS